MLQLEVEDEVVATDVADESSRSETPHHVAEHLGKESYDPVAIGVAVPVVELLEVVQVGVTHRKVLTELQARLHVARNMGGAGQPRRGVHGHVPVGPSQNLLETEPFLPFRQPGADHLVDPRLEEVRRPGLGAGPQKNDHRHDTREGILLDLPSQLNDERSVALVFEDHAPGVCPIEHRPEVFGVVDLHEGQPEIMGE